MQFRRGFRFLPFAMLLPLFVFGWTDVRSLGLTWFDFSGVKKELFYVDFPGVDLSWPKFF